MTTQLPTIEVERRRILHDDGIWRDSVRQPLYSSVGLNNAALPSEQAFFGYARGQNVPGAGNAAGVAATIFHTNMTSGGQLGAPKRFRADGFLLHLAQIAFTAAASTPELSDPGFDTASSDAELLEDLLVVAGSSWFELKVGEKFYINHPVYMLPSNYGFGGLAAVSQDNGTAATIGALDVTLPHSAGIPWSMNSYPFLIDSQESITSTLRTPWTSPSLNDDRLLFAVIQGNLYRGVQ